MEFILLAQSLFFININNSNFWAILCLFIALFIVEVTD